MLRSFIDRPFHQQESASRAVVLSAYALIVGSGVAVHEPWWDEAQAWLLARDASIRDLLSNWLAYEGHPPLWYSILAVPAKLGLPYKSINVVSAVIAFCGVVLLLRLRHVPMIFRAAIPFTFYAAYQYSVVSRSYVLVAPLLFAIAAIYDRRDDRLILFAILLSLLSLVSVHAACMAAALVFLFIVDLARSRQSVRKISVQALTVAATLLAATAILLIVVLWPPADLVTGSIIDLSFRPAKMSNIAMTVLSTLLVGSVTWEATAIAIAFVAILLFWFFERGVFLEFVVLFAALMPVTAMYYARWHEGLFFWTIVFALVLPQKKEVRHWVATVGWAIISLVLLLHCSWTARSLVYDAQFNYTGARDAARFIAENRLQEKRLFGAGVRCTELQPYFERNIFANYKTAGGVAFWDWSRNNSWPYPAPAPELRRMARWLSEQVALQPDAIVAASGFRSDAFYTALLRRRPDYREIARFHGGLFWKDRVIEWMDFEIFEKKESVGF